MKGEFLDYSSGDPILVHLPQLGGARPSLPKSHTSSGGLQWTQRAVHNLPSPSPDYIERSLLEDELSSLLTDNVHRIITLKGPGGIGKTTLALSVLDRLVDSSQCPFEFIVWLSARDVDLLLEGPVSRERDVANLDSIAELFVTEFEFYSDQSEARKIFLDHLTAAESPTLLVIDNFETLDDPEGLHRFLDTSVILPSKLLITSRHQTYRGDFPVEVLGMNEIEARALIEQEARTHSCEPCVTPSVSQKIISATSASPYA